MYVLVDARICNVCLYMLRPHTSIRNCIHVRYIHSNYGVFSEAMTRFHCRCSTVKWVIATDRGIYDARIM